jgi:hypothetical protein
VLLLLWLVLPNLNTAIISYIRASSIPLQVNWFIFVLAVACKQRGN